jgi:hypothetical protein
MDRTTINTNRVSHSRDGRLEPLLTGSGGLAYGADIVTGGALDDQAEGIYVFAFWR